MKILVVGGGSGGHVTPVVAVVSELQKQLVESEIRFWCDKAYYQQASELMAAHDKNITINTIYSGKLRRYHSLPVWRQVLMVRTVGIPNLIDGFKFLIGVIQSCLKLIRWRPDVVFTKGGFVCLPVGLSAHLLRIPLIIHDSDAHPGLTNRILSRWATTIATGSPTEYYPYPKNKTHYIGIPLVAGLEPLSQTQQNSAKASLGFNKELPLVLITGGGLGALRINNAAAVILPKLLQSGVSVMLVSGQKQYDELAQTLKAYETNSNFQLHSHISSGFQAALAAADVVISRAGATTLLELAALAKPTIVVPNARLTGGHQVKNAQTYLSRDAIEVVDDEELESNPEELLKALAKLLGDHNRRKELADNIYKMSKPNAAHDMAKLIIHALKS